MKLIIGLFVVMLIITSSLSLPAGSPNDDSDILNSTNTSENSSREDVDTNFNNFQGVVDTGVGDPYYSYTVNPLSFLDYFQDTLRIIREGIERKLWTQGGLEAEQDDSSIDDSKRNSTSVVEVIDGHKIEINETVYSNNNDGHAIFKVRVIQVRPLDLDDNLTSEVTSIVNESNNADNDANKPVENEINKIVISPEIFKLHHNTSDFTIYSTTTTLPYMTSSENADITVDEANLLDSTTNDFLNDTNSTNILDTTEEYQNFQNTDSETSIFDQDKYVEESTSTDANIVTTISTNIRSDYTRESLESESNEHQQTDDNLNNEWETLENDSSNELSNDFEMYSPVEIDLSNDILINDILSGQRATQHPETEIFSDVVINYNSNNNSQISKFIAESIIPSVQTNFSSTNIK